MIREPKEWIFRTLESLLQEKNSLGYRLLWWHWSLWNKILPCWNQIGLNWCSIWTMDQDLSLMLCKVRFKINQKGNKIINNKKKSRKLITLATKVHCKQKSEMWQLIVNNIQQSVGICNHKKGTIRQIWAHLANTFRYCTKLHFV